MKNYTLPLLTVLFPLVLNAQVVENLKELEQVRMDTGLCDMSDEELSKIESSFAKVKKSSKKGEFVAALAIRDAHSAREKCSADKKDKQNSLAAAILDNEPNFPMSIMVPWTNGEAERAQNLQALKFIQSKELSDCETIDMSQRYDSKKWHEVLINNGWTCIAKNYHRVSQELNASMGYATAQRDANDLKQLKLPELKKLFKETFNTKELKIALVPHLSWENGALNTVFPYSLFLKKTELTTYKFLVKELKKLGVESVFVERNSLNSLDQQVKETKENLLKLKGSHIVISRSMGARVMREIIAENNDEVNSKIGTYFNIGGTPHGSVIAQAKIHPDSFFRGTAPSVSGVFNLPLGIITKDPRLPDHLQDTLFAALDRNNLATMVPMQARQISESKIPALNAVFVRRDHERAAPLVDPVWQHMLQQGPTEGSSPLVGAAVDTSNSMRIVMDSDHLAFWKYTPQEGLEIYLRLLITAKKSGLIK